MTRPTGRRPGRPSATWTPDTEARLRDLIDAGMGPVMIGRALGCTANAVKGKLVALGLRTRLLCQSCRAAPPIRFGCYCAACGLVLKATKNERRRASRAASKPPTAAKEARTRASSPQPLPIPPKPDLRTVRPSTRPAAAPTAPPHPRASLTIADITREQWREMLRRVARHFTDEPLTFG